MRIFDSSNPLWTPSAAGAVVSFVPNRQGAAQPSLTLTGSTHITAYNLTAKDKDVINPVYSTFTLAGVVAGDTCVVNGVTYTAVASGAIANQFNVGGTDAATATNLAAAIAANLLLGIGAVFQVSSPKMIVELNATASSGQASAAATCEVSLDGSYFFSHPQLGTINATGTLTATVVSQQVDAYPFVRANVSALTGTGARAIMALRGVDFN